MKKVTKKDTELVRISGLWIMKDKSGNDYFRFAIQGITYMIFTNKFKDDKRSPTHVLYEVHEKSK